MMPRKTETCEITVSASYCQRIVIDILAKCLTGWGWKVTETSSGGFKAVLP